MYHKHAIKQIALLLFASTSTALASTSMPVKISNDLGKTIYYRITAHSKVCKSGNITASKYISFDAATQSQCGDGGRIYISDKNINQHIDQNNSELPLDDHYQLIEYTMTGINKPVSADYDFSAVDSLDNIPVTVEATKPNGETGMVGTGWTGTPNRLTQKYLSQNINSFSQELGWPAFTSTATKIPGGYNLYALTSPTDFPQEKAKKMRDIITARWFKWYNDKNYQLCSYDELSERRSTKDCQEFEDSVKLVINDFKTNAKNNNKKPNNDQVIQNIIGYVPFGQARDGLTADTAKHVIGLLRGVSQHGQTPKYLFPDYNSTYNLNPYVTFIHKTLGLNVYAFSIGSGNIYAPSYTGIHIDVGSTKSLPNQNPYTPELPSEYKIIVGSGWSYVVGSVCNTAVNNQFSIPVTFSQKKDCHVDLTLETASNKDHFQFDLGKDSGGHFTYHCSGSLCKQVVVGHYYINLPGAPANYNQYTT